MATRKERRCAYRAVVTALANVAQVDGCMERSAIAKALDDLGGIISDVGPGVVEQAIALRNGPLLRDRQPVSEYLRKELEPIVWTFSVKDVLALKSGSMTVSGELIREAYRQVMTTMPRALDGFSSSWGKAEPDGDCFVVTIYPSHDWYAEHVGDGKCCEVHPKPEQTPEGLLPTILVEYEWVLGMLEVDTTIELTIIRYAHGRLRDRKPKHYAKLTNSWWAEVAVTDIGYLVTFHYSGRLTCDNTL